MCWYKGRTETNGDEPGMNQARTGDEPGTNRGQTGDKLGTNWGQTGDEPRGQTEDEWWTNQCHIRGLIGRFQNY